ncbi:unnamed protein product [Ilex paraguariensis]|uniref:F-box domain-containing protein n=1 Tax=Ilex paraguariensis TaxID=185542 RepID=A0ABC8SWE3_9AQUA
METRSAKKKKLLNANKEDDKSGEDRISDLPDAVLHHILFFLPIRSIAQTGILSKRWRDLWLSFPDLDFTTTTPHSNNASKTMNYLTSHKKMHSHIAKVMIMDFITQVLSLRGKLCDIRILRFRAQLSFSRLNGLIRRAIRHNVQELDIEVAMEDYFNFPRSVISSNSLRVFKLKSRYPGFRLPPSSTMEGGFRSLHTLSLSFVILYERPSLGDFFTDSSFPLLKKLNLDTCFGLKHLSVSCRALEYFTLENCFQLENLEISGPKMEILRVSSCFDAHSSTSFVKIEAPRLKIIFWAYNAITDNYILENLTSLHEASFGFFVLREDMMSAEKVWSLSNFLSGLSHAQRLILLESQCVELLSKNNDLNGGVLPPFDNLKSLEVRTGFNKYNNILRFASLLGNFPTLHTLIIKFFSVSKTERRYNLISSNSSNGTRTHGMSLAQAKNSAGDLKAKP